MVLLNSEKLNRLFNELKNHGYNVTIQHRGNTADGIYYPEIKIENTMDWADNSLDQYTFWNEIKRLYSNKFNLSTAGFYGFEYLLITEK